MKRTLLFLCPLFFLIGINVNILAQPAQKFVNVVISPDHADWQYKAGESVNFNVQVYKNNVLMKNVTIEYELGPEFFPTENKKDIILKDGKITLKSTMKEPGFLRCKVVAIVEGIRYVELATVGYDIDKIMPTTSEPKDFDDFWRNAIEDAKKLSLDPELTLLPEKCTSKLNFYEVSFQNEWLGSRIYGILTVPKKQGKYPAILQVPGAGIRPYNGTSFGDEVISLEIGIHGIPVTLSPEVYQNLNAGALNGYPRVNMNDRNTHYYKRVFLGCVRAVDFIYSLPEFNGHTLGVTGGSQGGALSIITAALDSRVKFIAAYYPAMCDYAGYLNGRAGGWPHYFRNTKPKANEVETLAYYDVVNFAARVHVPGLYAWGFNDTTCPPTSMHAAYNVIPGEKELHFYLNTGHWTYPEQRSMVGQWLKKQWEKDN